MLGQSTASVLAAKLYEDRMKHPHSMDSETSPQLIDASRMALLKSASNHPGVGCSLRALLADTDSWSKDIKAEANVGLTQRSLPMDPSSIYGQGLNQGVSGLPLKGWPLTGIDQLRPSLGAQVQKPFLQTPNQFQLLTTQQQQLLAQAQAQGSLGSSPNYGDMDPRRIRGLPRASLNAKDGLSSGNDGSIDVDKPDSEEYRMFDQYCNGPNSEDIEADTNEGSKPNISEITRRVDLSQQKEYITYTHRQPVHSSDIVPHNASDLELPIAHHKGVLCYKQMKMAQMQQSTSQQQQDQLQQQQLQQVNNRKRKQPSSSGAANSTGTGNTVGPSPNSPPSTPSTHTPGDGVPMTGGLQHVSSMQKSLAMFGSDGTGGLASSTNQLEDMEHFGDVGSLDDNVESFLSHDDVDGRDLFGTLKRSSTEHNTESSKGFTFSEVGCIRTSNSKVVCCHFSSDGKLLASAGHEKKAVLWNMDTLQTESTPEEHSLIITDVRFRPNSTQLATSSFDRTVRLWNAAEGGSAQVRFQPRIGHLLAAASENVVSIFDVETDRQTLSLQRHSKEVHSICWDANGDYLASVSQDSVRVWSLTTGECIHELSSSGNKFHSCVFHPSYSTLLVIGGYQVILYSYFGNNTSCILLKDSISADSIFWLDTIANFGCLQSLELWNMAENKSMTVTAHEGLIAALAQSPVNGMVASASHDKSVKLWK
ncbi:hypothetical protein HHK36_022368 [Tetracentron sinense]|uniref:Uncharacterized protein n=1 Tax=Tetracentron sinense TaxID=13715 RepID=A0A835D614_TETSI|nr:hypothetical protein HHK36_022368 [Tetracentron sinense]